MHYLFKFCLWQYVRGQTNISILIWRPMKTFYRFTKFAVSMYYHYKTWQLSEINPAPGGLTRQRGVRPAGVMDDGDLHGTYDSCVSFSQHILLPKRMNWRRKLKSWNSYKVRLAVTLARLHTFGKAEGSTLYSNNNWGGIFLRWITMRLQYMVIGHDLKWLYAW